MAQQTAPKTLRIELLEHTIIDAVVKEPGDKVTVPAALAARLISRQRAKPVEVATETAIADPTKSAKK